MKHKKFLSLLLSLVLVLSFTIPALAADSSLNFPLTSSSTAEEAADYLYSLGLFQGTGATDDGAPIYELTASPTRAQGVTMLVRLIGKEAEAQKNTWTTPFTDVPDWAKSYVGYAYENGLTKGRDATAFDPDTAMTASEYLTLALRALGYDSSADFSWDAAWVLTNKLGITTAGTYENTARVFTRGDVASISAQTLAAKVKNSDTTLLKSLIDLGALQHVYFLETVTTSALNQLYLSFAPTYSSPETYTSFVINSVTANGVACTIKQYSTPKDVTDYCAQLDKDVASKVAPEGTFAMVGLQYDEKAASAAATRHYTEDLGEGETYDYPIIDFKFTATGTLADGTTVTESFVCSYHMDAYDGPLSWF